MFAEKVAGLPDRSENVPDFDLYVLRLAADEVEFKRVERGFGEAAMVIIREPESLLRQPQKIVVHCLVAVLIVQQAQTIGTRPEAEGECHGAILNILFRKLEFLGCIVVPQALVIEKDSDGYLSLLRSYPGYSDFNGLSIQLR